MPLSVGFVGRDGYRAPDAFADPRRGTAAKRRSGPLSAAGCQEPYTITLRKRGLLFISCPPSGQRELLGVGQAELAAGRGGGQSGHKKHRLARKTRRPPLLFRAARKPQRFSAASGGG